MVFKALTLMGGLAGAAALSQGPEFAAQYSQRLGGAVDALRVVVADFDASAAAEGLSREAALAQMTGGGFVARRRGDMARTFERFDRLRVDQAALRGAGGLGRVAHLVRRPDLALAAQTWGDFEPALPLTAAGAGMGAAGFALGTGLVALLRRGRRLFRRRSVAAEAGV